MNKFKYNLFCYFVYIPQTVIFPEFIYTYPKQIVKSWVLIKSLFQSKIMIMKRLLLIVSILAFTLPAYSQFKIGLQVSPSLSFNRVRDEAPANFSSSGIGGRIIAGIITDYNFQENYFVSSGLFFIPKRVGFREEGTNQIKEIHRLHYLQIPATLKLFTNEVALDTRIYFQVGLTADVKILEDNISDQVEYIEDFRPVDSSVLVGAGAEYRFGYNTIVFGGLTYRRGLANVIRNYRVSSAEGLIIKNDMLSLDLGIKF